MKVLHIPYTWTPDPIGGTEVYVAELVRELGALGVESIVAAPRAGSSAAREVIDGIVVHRYGLPEAPRDIRELYGAGTRESVAAISAVLDAEDPHIVHMHAYTPASGGSVALEIARRGIPLVTTYHTPAVSCQRGTLLRFGETPCDGRLFVGRCTACVLQHRGIPRPVADLLALFPAAAGRAIAGDRIGPFLGLRGRELMVLHHRDVRRWLGAPRRVVAVAEWVRDLLVRLGVPAERIVLSRQGIARDFGVISRGEKVSGGPVRAIVVARMDPIKGIADVVTAVRALPALAIELEIAGGPLNTPYAAELRAAAAGDDRIRFLGSLSREALAKKLAAHDVLLVPSRALETGPLAVLEAFACGVPVIGTPLGGVAELVEDGRTGMLVAGVGDAPWRDAFVWLAEHRHAIEQWRAAITPPRTMAESARDMAAIYSDIVAPDAASTSPT